MNTLTKLQYNVTQNGMDESPYANEYWDNADEGIYVDIVSGEPLFSSKDKYDARTGWPSFTKPLESDNVVLKRKGMFWDRSQESACGFLPGRRVQRRAATNGNAILRELCSHDIHS